MSLAISILKWLGIGLAILAFLCTAMAFSVVWIIAFMHSWHSFFNVVEEVLERIDFWSTVVGGIALAIAIFSILILVVVPYGAYRATSKMVRENFLYRRCLS